MEVDLKMYIYMMKEFNQTEHFLLHKVISDRCEMFTETWRNRRDFQCLFMLRVNCVKLLQEISLIYN